ncbi:MAG: ROK family protein [Bacteroidales bacterium]|nr:ROK family protein [Bacteroidales bacterium]
MNPEQMKPSIGIDIGGTNTDIGLVSPQGQCTDRINISTTAFPDFVAYIDDICIKINELLKRNGLAVEQISGVGVGAPNGNSFTHTIDFAPNLPYKGRLHIGEMLAERLHTRVAVANDANAAAVGEKVYGGAQTMDDFATVTLGTGLGSGIYANGRLLLGHDGMAGELGHTILYPEGRRCSCGRSGCVETYVSIRGVQQTYREICEEQGISPVPQISCAEISAEAATPEGDVARETWCRTGKHLGLALANTVTLFSPEAIFLMGGLAQAGDLLLLPVREQFEHCVLPFHQNKIRIELSHLKSNEAAILGAAALTSM